MVFIRRVKTKSGATAIQIAHKRYGRIVRIEHIGSAHTQQEEVLLTELAHQKLQYHQPSLFSSFTNIHELILKSSSSTLLRNVLLKEYETLGIDSLADEIFALLTIARIVEPVSKLDSLRVLSELGVNSIDKGKLYRCLNRVVTKDYRQTISSLCFKYASSFGIHLVLYDVTTLYFEVEREDNYRKPGLSKERRLEPQIVIGLLVNQIGFPLGLTSFEGNTAETKTILPVINDFCRRHKISRITVVADAAMLSAGNLTALEEAGHRYIVGSRFTKIPYDIVDYQSRNHFTDGQIIETTCKNHRIIYQYRKKRADLDSQNIQKQIDKAKRIIAGKSSVSKNKFVTVTATTKKLNQHLIDKAKALVGIKGYVTNMDSAPQQIIDYYQELFKIEANFRMAKSDFKARPIFHRKRDSIEAHLTIVLAALAIGKSIEMKTQISIKQVVKLLRPVRTGTIVVNGKEYEAKENITQSIETLLQKLQAGH